MDDSSERWFLKFIMTGCDVPGHISSHSTGPRRLTSADGAGVLPCSWAAISNSSDFIAWEKSAKRLLSGERYPFPFCHTPLFAFFSWGPTLFLCPCYHLCFLCTGCVSSKCSILWAGDRGLTEPGLCIHVLWRYCTAGITLELAVPFGAGRDGRLPTLATCWMLHCHHQIYSSTHILLLHS